MRVSLNDGWLMRAPGFAKTFAAGNIPVSALDTLVREGVLQNPYIGENADLALSAMRNDYIFTKKFDAGEALLAAEAVVLRFHGIDTIGDVCLNGTLLFRADNMHRTYEVSVKPLLKAGDNELSLTLFSPVLAAEEANAADPIWGASHAVEGFMHVRKAHSMYGWDWGPQIPDSGIWRDVELVGRSAGFIDGVYPVQRFRKDHSELNLTLEVEAAVWKPGLTLSARVQLSDGRLLHVENQKLPHVPGEYRKMSLALTINKPPLWYPRGYGEQPLQLITVALCDGNIAVDTKTFAIGFRYLTINKNNSEKTAEAPAFAFHCNGIDIFALGADVIPQDHILPWITQKKTREMFEAFTGANYNTIRVWGGGNYPDDAFLAECDRQGFVLWQDFMFACAVYRLTPAFAESIKHELRDNIKRIRHHACLGLWCGNNEIETAIECWGNDVSDELKQDYLRIFEEIIPETLRELDPETFYWPSSPSSGGGTAAFNDTEGLRSYDFTHGDQHYWDVWHSFAPIEAFAKNNYSFCSEYGFESLPDIKTVRYFAGDGELNLTSPVMEAHQKCTAGNEKLLYYIAQMTPYPYDFESLIYASQLVQSDAIRADVEHMRSHRGECMGSLYWQVNDSNPVISWASVDYFGRWKGLHYAAKRFYAPLLLACDAENTGNIKITLCNETTKPFAGVMRWHLRDNAACVIASGEQSAYAKPLSAAPFRSIDLSAYLGTKEQRRSRYIEYELHDVSDVYNTRVLSKNTALFVRAKSFAFLPPHVTAQITAAGDKLEIALTARNYAKSVQLAFSNADRTFSDNWFDLHGENVVKITCDKGHLTPEKAQRQLRIRCCNDLIK